MKNKNKRTTVLNTNPSSISNLNFTPSVLSILSLRLLRLFLGLKGLYKKYKIIRLLYNVSYYVYRAIMFITFVFGGGFVLSLTFVQDFNTVIYFINYFKDYVIFNLLNLLLKNLSNSADFLLSEEAYSKIKKSFPNAKESIDSSSTNENLRKSYRIDTYSWIEDDLSKETKPFYKDPLIIIAGLSLVAIGLIYWYHEDIINFFKGGDSGNNKPTSPSTPDSSASSMDKFYNGKQKEVFKRFSLFNSPPTSPLDTNKTIELHPLLPTSEEINKSVQASSINEGSTIESTINTTQPATPTPSTSRLRFFNTTDKIRTDYEDYFGSPNKSNNLDQISPSSSSGTITPTGVPATPVNKNLPDLPSSPDLSEATKPLAKATNQVTKAWSNIFK